ncbi:ImuA family protein [Acidisoma sp. 7E03]
MPQDLDALRAAVARLERHEATQPAPGIALGPDLPHLTLQRGAYHEILVADPGAALGFAACVQGQAHGESIWISGNPDFWPGGLAAFGVASGQLVFVKATSLKDGLWAFEESLRSRGIAGAVLVVDGPAPDLVAGRRLQIAAETGGGIGLLLMPDTDRLSPSAARSRWRLGAFPRGWDVTLLRGAGGRSGRWQVAWDRECRELRPLQPAPDRRNAAGHRA